MRGFTHTIGWTPWTRRGNSLRGHPSRSRGRWHRLSFCFMSQRTPTSGKPWWLQTKEESLKLLGLAHPEETGGSRS
jgi:hypothetical protein